MTRPHFLYPIHNTQYSRKKSALLLEWHRWPTQKERRYVYVTRKLAELGAELGFQVLNDFLHHSVDLLVLQGLLVVLQGHADGV